MWLARPTLAQLRRGGCALIWGSALALAGTCGAASPQAWSAFDQEVLKACVAASSLRQAQAAGARVDFDDRIGYSALLLVGRYPQAHMHSASGRELCLFDRRSRTAVVSDADALVQSTKKTPSTPPPAP